MHHQSPRAGKRAGRRAGLGIVIFLLASFASAEGDRTVIDLYSKALRLDFGMVATMQNPTGIGGAVDLRFVEPDAWIARARASYGYGFMGGDDVAADLDYLLGVNGLKAQAGFDLVTSAKTEMRKYFKKVKLISRGSSSELWQGYYYNAPFYTTSSLGLDLLLENSGIYTAGLSDTAATVEWSPKTGYSLYLYPHLGWSFSDNFHLIDAATGDVHEKVYAYISLGALACPDLTQYGAATEMLLSMPLGASKSELYMDLMFGFVLRDEVPAGEAIRGRDDPAGGIDGFYVPFRIDFGINIPTGSGKKEAAK